MPGIEHSVLQRLWTIDEDTGKVACQNRERASNPCARSSPTTDSPRHNRRQRREPDGRLWGECHGHRQVGLIGPTPQPRSARPKLCRPVRTGSTYRLHGRERSGGRICKISARRLR
jgi:hypothetical protein